ncbi:1-deoxyxylulose-5-phosphate synthase, thiamine-requiring, FAD-requiring [uncultured Desulfobacterium sp.]|uniref:1-deoxy-D-xylulose-5-phosphate synthase n=1 Tax=uncultured Desulfobacterium sp. TaxID=201089 RepID=A0A445N252_9BACT|nr:1-deoxyxylulose-5-phosphate synthase, thiamine-requiring, FAD-requiring [uncultured Desulfobacterium sp.]
MSFIGGNDGLLDNINSPDDLHGLSIGQLEALAKELRQRIIQTVAKTGGHLAPSLGVVELTIALHYVFNAPRDKIIWDVGHQAYAHKLITGRRDQFHTLRTYGGLSGFPKRSESPYDTFDTGHSSTSISAGLGISTGKALKGEKDKVVAVIGDGSMTAGMAFEGLNQAGETEKDLIVVLNDNAMSIAPNVGAFSSFLSRKMTGRRFVGLKRDLENFIRSFPGVGENILNLVRKSEDSFITFFTPGMLFEAFKFQYMGPIRGHRLQELIEALTNAKNLNGPVLVHVLTVKGKGYPPAEKDPAHFHGVGSFEIPTGTPLKHKPKSPPSYTDVFGKTMVELGRKNNKIFAITAAMPEGTGLTGFSEAYPERFLDVGIAEQHAVTFAAGLATEGFRPVVAIYSTFLQRAFDQIVHDVCMPNLPVVFAIDRGGLVGEDGPTHHGHFDITYLRSLPNITLMAPKDENELRHMIYTALEHPGPVAIRYPRGNGLGVVCDPELKAIAIGEAEVIKDGGEILIIALGNCVQPSLEAAEELEKEGRSVAVVNCRFVKPLDKRLADMAARIGRVLVVEENIRQGGLGSAFLEMLNDNGIEGVHIRRIGLPDKFIEHGPAGLLREKYGLDAEGIVQKARELL